MILGCAIGVNVLFSVLASLLPRQQLSSYGSSLALWAVKLLAEGLPGIHQRFIPKKHFVCSRESTKCFLRVFFLEMVPKKNTSFKMTYLASLQ